MKQIIEIEVPDGKKAVWKDDNIVFEDIEPQLPNTWDEFCKNYPIKSGEFYIDPSSQILVPGWRYRHEYGNRNVLPNHEAAEAHLALMQLHQLRDCYRQGWEPNLCEPKSIFAILYIKNSYIVRNYISVSEFLTFQSKEIANKFLHNFRDLIEQADDLI